VSLVLFADLYAQHGSLEVLGLGLAAQRVDGQRHLRDVLLLEQVDGLEVFGVGHSVFADGAGEGVHVLAKGKVTALGCDLWHCFWLQFVYQPFELKTQGNFRNLGH